MGHWWVVDFQNQNFSLLETCESNIQSPLDLKSLRLALSFCSAVLGDLLTHDAHGSKTKSSSKSVCFCVPLKLEMQQAMKVMYLIK